jgi:hypothetical protein
MHIADLIGSNIITWCNQIPNKYLVCTEFSLAAYIRIPYKWLQGFLTIIKTIRPLDTNLKCFTSQHFPRPIFFIFLSLFSPPNLNSLTRFSTQNTGIYALPSSARYACHLITTWATRVKGYWVSSRHLSSCSQNRTQCWGKWICLPIQVNSLGVTYTVDQLEFSSVTGTGYRRVFHYSLSHSIEFNWEGASLLQPFHQLPPPGIPCVLARAVSVFTTRVGAGTSR